MKNLEKIAGIAAITLASSALTYSLVACNALPVQQRAVQPSPSCIDQAVAVPVHEISDSKSGLHCTLQYPTSSPVKDYIALRLDLQLDCRIDDIWTKYNEWRGGRKRLFD